MYKFKETTLKEATLATIVDRFQHDYSSKMALFIESMRHRCRSCGGDSDWLILLTPVQSTRRGMSILDTFHERKLKQLNQRLQTMLFARLSMKSNSSTNDELTEDKTFLNDFYQDFRRQDSKTRDRSFQLLKKSLERVDVATRHIKRTSTFSPMGESTVSSCLVD
jgi:hypothetical protein